MKVVIFGATGGIGKHLIVQALEAGHEVTAFARKPKELPSYVGKIRVMSGDLLDLPAVEESVKGQDVVLSSFGSRNRKGDIYIHGIANIIEAMTNEQVKRLICVTAAAVDDSSELNFIFRRIVKPFLLKDVYRGMKQLEVNVESTNLDWTIIGPARLTDGPRTGVYRISEHDIPKGGSAISRADVADLMLKEVGDTKHIHKKIIQTY